MKAHNSFIPRSARAWSVGGHWTARGTLLALGLVVVSSAGLLAGAATPSPDRAQYVYRGGSVLDNVQEASCDATGLLFPKFSAGRVEIQAHGGTLHLRKTWLNRTIVAGVALDDPASVADRPVGFAEGPVTITWAPQGTVTAYATDPAQGMVARWSSGRLDAAQLELAPSGPYPFWRAGSEAASRYDGAFVGPSRAVSSTTRTQVVGDASLLLHQASIDLPGGTRYELPAWHSETRISNGPIDRVSIVYEDAFLDVDDATWTTPQGVGLTICRGLQARTVNGGATAVDADGNALVAGTLRDFDGRAIAYHGSFELSESTPDPSAFADGAGAVTATTTGRFDAWGLDFVPVARGPATMAWAAAATGGGLLALILARLSWGPVVGAFYARFGRDRVLDHPLRRTLFELVQSNPALPQSVLAERLGIREKLAAYHLRVLERTNLVRTWHGRRRGRPWRLVLPGGMPPAEAKKLVLAFHEENDAKLRSLRRLLEPAALPQRAVTAALVEEFAITERGARKVLQRAAELGLVAREKRDEGKGEWVRCASS